MLKRFKKEMSLLLVFALVVTSICFGFIFPTQALTNAGSWRIYAATRENVWWNPLQWDQGTNDPVVIKMWSGADGTGTLLYTSAGLGEALVGAAGASGSITATDVPTTNQIASITFNKVSGTDKWGCASLAVYYTPSGGSEQEIGLINPNAEYDDNDNHLLCNTSFFTAAHNRYITFDSNSGSGTMPPQYLIWGTADYLNANAFSLIGYSFLGWAASESGADAGTVDYADGFDFTMPDSNPTLYAVWGPNIIPYTVYHYRENIDKTAFDILTETENLMGAAGSTVTATDKSYNGFTAVTPLASGAIAGDGSLVLTQNYSRNSYMITFDAAGGTGGSATSMVYESPLAAPSVAREGYTFAGWSAEIPATVPAGDMTFTALWTAIEYSIAFDANGGTGGEVQTVAYDALPTPPVVTKTGYTFAGWDPEVAAVTGDTTYTAQWTAIEYAITFDANGGEGGEVQTVAFGTTPTPPVVTKTGYTFAGWDPEVVAVTGDATYTAQWTINNYVITFDASGGLGGEVQFLDYGATPTPPTVTKTGYTFAGWDPAVSAVTGDATYTAQWTAIDYSITFDANGGEGGEVQTVAFGSTPTPPVVTKTGYTFAGWDPEVSPVTGDTTYTAQWTAIEYAITFDANGGEGGEVQTVAFGITPTPPAVTRLDYAFAGWDSEIAAVTGDATYTAQWIMLGDIDFNGRINVLDARLALQKASGLITLTPTQMLAGDVNKSGGANPINVIDARLILQYASGLILHFS